MAQVNIQKLQSGGSTKKYGTFTKDGVTYQVDDDFLQAMTAHGSSIADGRARANYGAIVNALRSGADLSYDSNTNELRGDVSFNNLTDRQKRRAARRTSKTGEGIDRLFNNRVNQVKVATDALRNFNYNQTAPATQNTNQSVDVSRRLYLNYERDKDGNLVLDENNRRKFIPGTYNSAVFDRLDFLKNLANEQNIVDWKGYENQTKDAYLNFIQNYNDWDGLKQRIKDGSITDNDINVLSQIGILDRNQSSDNEDNNDNADSNASKWDKDNNFTEEFRNKYKISYGPNGKILTEGFGLDGYGSNWSNAYFGDNFAELYPELKRFKDYILYEGRLYSKNEWADPNSEIHQILSSPRVDIFNKMRQNLFDPVQNGKWQVLWTNNPFTRYNSELQYNPYFNQNYKDDNNVLYSYTTPLYQNLPQGVTVMDIIDKNTPRNEFGVPTSISSVGLDQNGNVVDLSEYVRANGYNGEATGDAFYSRIPLTDKILGGYIWDDFDESGKYSFAYNPEDESQGYFYDSENQKLYPFSRSWFQSLLNDNYLSADEINAIKHRDWSAFRRWLNAGFFNDEYAGKRVPAIGYVRQVPKQQTGGLINWISKDTEKSSPKVETRNEKQAATTSQIKKGDLTAADKWQLGALAADLGALVAAIPTGGNPVAAALGAGSTASQFISDVKRDGLDIKDIGNAALGLGLDLVSFLPGVGIAGKAAKTARVIKRIKPLLSAGFSAMGLSAALTSLNKEGEWTLDDYRNILLGVQGLMGGKRALDRAVGYKKTGNPANVTKKVSPEKLVDIQKGALDELVSKNPSKFKDKSWYDVEKKSINYDEALKDTEIIDALPKSKIYQEGISRIKAATKNLETSIVDRLTGDNSELRARTVDELPWFLQNKFGRNWLISAQNREFGNVVDRLANRAEYQRNYDASETSGLNIFERGYRTAGELINGDKAYYNPYWFPQPKPFRIPKPQMSKQLLLPKTAGQWVQLPNDGGMVYRPQRLYKKGGKIVKAQNGLYFGKQNLGNDTYGNFNADPVTVTAWEKGVILPQQAQKDARMRLLGEQITGRDPKNPFNVNPNSPILTNGISLNSTTQNVPLNVQLNRHLRDEAYLDLKNPYRKYFTKTTSSPTATSSPAQTETTQSQNNSDVASTGTSNTGQRSFNPKNLLDIASLAGGLISNARQRKEIEKGIVAAALGAMPEDETEIYRSYNDSHINRAYDNIVDQLRYSKTVTSDPLQVQSDQLSRDLQVNLANKERYAELSKYQTAFNEQDIADRRMYSAKRTANANARRSILGQMKNAVAQNTAAKQFTDWNQIINPFIDQKRMDLVRDQQEEQAAKTVRDNLALQQDMQKKFIDLYNSKQAQDAWLNEQKINPNWKTEYGDSEAGRRAFLDKYYSGTIQNMQNDLMMRTQLNGYINGRSRFTGGYRTLTIPESTIQDYYRPSSFYTTLASVHKKGGTITKRYRDFDEQSLLDKAKDYRRAVQKMDDNLVKFLLKMFS